MRDTVVIALSQDDILKYSQTVCDGLTGTMTGYAGRCRPMPATAGRSGLFTRLAYMVSYVRRISASACMCHAANADANASPS